MTMCARSFKLYVRNELIVIASNRELKCRQSLANAPSAQAFYGLGMRCCLRKRMSIYP